MLCTATGLRSVPLHILPDAIGVRVLKVGSVDANSNTGGIYLLLVYTKVSAARSCCRLNVCLYLSILLSILPNSPVLRVQSSWSTWQCTDILREPRSHLTSKLLRQTSDAVPGLRLIAIARLVGVQESELPLFGLGSGPTRRRRLYSDPLYGCGTQGLDLPLPS